MKAHTLAFDAYGTLLDVYSVAATCRLELGDAADLVVEAWRTKQLEYTWLLSLMGRFVDFWEVTGRALDYALALAASPLGPQGRQRLLDSYLALEPYPDVAGALGALEGCRRVVLSNGSRGMLEAAMSSSGLAERFEALLSADDAGIFKPSPRVYRLAVDHFGVSADSIAFVSANAWDIAGAAAFGFRTVWVNRAGRPAEALAFAPGAEIESLAGLREVI